MLAIQPTHLWAVLEIPVILILKINGKFYDILKNQGKLQWLYPESP